jgi:hypothetical protein
LPPRSSVSYWAKVVAVNVLLLVVLLLAAEGAYRLLSPDGVFFRRTYIGTDRPGPRTWARPDARLGWVFSGTNLDTFKRSSRDWSASANQEGFRATYNYRSRAPKAGTIRVMLLGNSFVFGPYLNDSETLSSVLQQRLGPGYEVDNFGIPGWGVDQMFLAYQEYVDVVTPDVVLVVFIDDDILRVFVSVRGTVTSKPRFELVDGHLQLRHDGEPDLLERLAGLSIIVNRFYKYVYRPPVSAGIARALFLELARETRRRNQKLVVLRYPSTAEIFRDGKATFDLSEFFRREGIPYLDPSHAIRATGAARYQEFYLSDDPHPAPEGNRFVADYLAKSAFANR